MQLSRGCIVASIQVELSEAVLARFRVDLLHMLQQSGAGAIVLDVSGVSVLDLEEFQALHDTANMAALMGARVVFSGFQPGVVSALVELDACTDHIDATFNLDSAFAMLTAAAPDTDAEADLDEAASDHGRDGEGAADAAESKETASEASDRGAGGEYGRGL
jgi:rsbT antagonist protein RsbS